MNYRVTILALFLAIFGLSSASATDRFVDPAGSDAGPNDCTLIGSPCATIAHALTQALQGDTIVLFAGKTFPEGNLVIDKDFITIRSDWGADAPIFDGINRTFNPASGLGSVICEAGEACLDTDGFAFGIEIQANNVTIDGLQIVGDADDTGAEDTYAGVVVRTGALRWTVKNTIIHNIGQKVAGWEFNHAYGIFVDTQTTSGSVTTTGGEVADNFIFKLGGVNLGGADVSAGVAVHMEGLSGDVSKCDSINKFACGAWVHDNDFRDLARGLNINNFDEFVDGREQSIGVFIRQDPQNALPNNGARVNDNNYTDHSVDGTRLDVGVFIGIGGSAVEEPNGSFTGTLTNPVIAYVFNAGRGADVDELALAPFFKSLNPNPQSLLGPSSDAYFSDNTGLFKFADDNSDETATIVELSVGPLHVLEVFPGGETTSVRVSIDNDGDLNVREGARLLYDDAFGTAAPAVAGVAQVLLNGTQGDDLLTLDFVNGNPIPEGIAGGCALLEHPDSDDCGLQFDAVGGFDAVTLRGAEQVTDQAYYMGNGGLGTASDEGSGSIVFEYAGLFPPTITAGTTKIVNFLNIEPINDVVITNGTFAVVAQDDVDHEINLIDGPTVFGLNTFQINSGATPTFEKINFRNKKNVVIHGAEDATVSGFGRDIFTVFTPDGDAPALLQSVSLFGGKAAVNPTLDDYFVVRPSADFPISVDGQDAAGSDWFFVDCALVPGCIPLSSPIAAAGTVTVPGFEDVDWAGMEATALTHTEDLTISKTVNTFGDAHPGDVVEYTVTVTNNGAAPVDLTLLPIWVTDVIDHRLSVQDQSIVVDEGTVNITSNRALLWRLDQDGSFAVGETATLTYSTIVNTLITTESIINWASILNPDGALADNHDDTTVEIERVFGFPAKAAIQASVFAPTDAGPRYIVGLFGGAVDPGTLNIGAVMCRVPDQNKAVGWDGGLGNLWYSCSEGLPAKDGLFSPLVVTDLFRDQSGRIWLTSWGFNGLYFSDDDGKTWTAPVLDLGGGPGNAPDGNPDTFNQIYAISEDINGTLFISANNGDMLRSFDGGVTWQRAKQLPLGSADTPWSLEADPTTPGKLYAGTFGDSLYVTSDFGETWQRPDGNGLGNGNIFDIEFDPISGNLFVGTALGVYYTADEGDNWTGLNTAFPIPSVPPEVRHVAFDENGVFFAGTWGQGVWVSPNWQGTALSEFALKAGEIADIAFGDGGVYILSSGAEMFRFDRVDFASAVDTEEPGTELPNAYSLNQNYPNPFGAQTTIQFSLPASQDVRLEIYDVLGRRVATLVDGTMTAGQHAVQFTAPNLSNGMYLYRLSTPTGSETKSMVLLK